MFSLLSAGDVLFSPGSQSYLYVVSGPICRLYNLDELPYPCCRFQWKGKEPSWNREGRQYVPDLATRRHPSYHTHLWVSQGAGKGYFAPKELTLYWEPPLSTAGQRWWSRNRSPVQHSSHWHQRGKGLLIWDAVGRTAITGPPLQPAVLQPPQDLFVTPLPQLSVFCEDAAGCEQKTTPQIA